MTKIQMKGTKKQIIGYEQIENGTIHLLEMWIVPFLTILKAVICLNQICNGIN